MNDDQAKRRELPEDLRAALQKLSVEGVLKICVEFEKLPDPPRARLKLIKGGKKDPADTLKGKFTL
jgi:hypothetical protein